MSLDTRCLQGALWQGSLISHCFSQYKKIEIGMHHTLLFVKKMKQLATYSAALVCGLSVIIALDLNKIVSTLCPPHFFHWAFHRNVMILGVLSSSWIDSFGSSPCTYPWNPPQQTRTLLEICWLFISIHSPFFNFESHPCIVWAFSFGHSATRHWFLRTKSILALSTTVVLDDLDVRRRERLL
jgi:hypothetical protein